MIKIFLKGLVFGFGMIAAFVIVALAATSMDLIRLNSSVSDNRDWFGLSNEERIKRSTAVLIIRYKPQDEGLMSAYVAEIHKKSDSVDVPAVVGHRWEAADYYSRADEYSRDRDGAIIFLTGNVAEERSTLYLYEDRISGAGDMPLEIFLRKFKEYSKDDA